MEEDEIKEKLFENAKYIVTIKGSEKNVGEITRIIDSILTDKYGLKDTRDPSLGHAAFRKDGIRFKGGRLGGMLTRGFSCTFSGPLE
ncbi:MAG: hypothetical protein GTN40_00430, partial [Candidatus Aenigmarchaeota archaeon]|nr:hypothetical protein [Candidatus Aenigmarchaeota archaeon]NIO44428.1 hypothetical protein [Candidatus Aenigmarchaeota archaeon]